MRLNVDTQQTPQSTAKNASLGNSGPDRRKKPNEWDDPLGWTLSVEVFIRECIISSLNMHTILKIIIMLYNISYLILLPRAKQLFYLLILLKFYINWYTKYIWNINIIWHWTLLLLWLCIISIKVSKSMQYYILLPYTFTWKEKNFLKHTFQQIFKRFQFSTN